MRLLMMGAVLAGAVGLARADETGDDFPCTPAVAISSPAACVKQKANVQFQVTGTYAPNTAAVTIEIVDSCNKSTNYKTMSANGSFTSALISLPAGVYTLKAKIIGTAAVTSQGLTVDP